MAESAQTLVDGVLAAWAETRVRLARFDEWRRRVASELRELPDTLQRLRNGAVNFELVGERLAKSSAALEEIADAFQATVAEPARRSADALDALRAQVDALAASAGAPEKVAATMSDVERAFETMANLNPFWPRPRRSDDR